MTSSEEAPSVRLPATILSAESCATCRIRSFEGTPGMRPPAMAASRVLFPVPFLPTKPYLRHEASA